jgi:hypothetical protein
MSHIVLVLDSSGSMASIKNDIVGSVNEFIKGQQYAEVKEIPIFTLVKFSDTVQTVVEKPLNQIRPITDKDYTPTGSTALYDAIGMTMEKLKDKKRVIMVIVTDGQENASRKFNRKQIFDMINEYKTKAEWAFIYLSSDIDTFAQGDNIGCKNTVINSTGECSFGIKGGAYNKCVNGNYNLGSELATNCNKQISDFRKTGIMKCQTTDPQKSSTTTTSTTKSTSTSTTITNAKTIPVPTPNSGYNWSSNAAPGYGYSPGNAQAHINVPEKNTSGWSLF